jgi:uncharacterized oxidoreductase
MTNSLVFSTANILITGGSEGIRLGLAERFIKAGARVLVTGRSTHKLERAAAALAGLQTLVNDISIAADREHLAQQVRDLVPVMLAHGRPSLIANVTSGGALIPQPFAPLYNACKAALHSYTMNLRFALTGTPCRVVEIIPPALRTTLAGPGEAHGAAVNEFCDTVLESLAVGTVTAIGFGASSRPCNLFGSWRIQ